ncbi:MAG TPA: hypothetical protein VLA84_23790 [Microcoleus sp.]|nr:hypothetical protein [Microcoleus sp.]
MVKNWNGVIEITAIGNRAYTDKTRLRGLKAFSVREGGHCLCRRDFYSPGIFIVFIVL